jgi:hypothetical protein
VSKMFEYIAFDVLESDEEHSSTATSVLGAESRDTAMPSRQRTIGTLGTLVALPPK